jgi:cathepsin D
MAVDRAGDMCLGGIFDLSQGTGVTPGSGNPGWVVGATFLVRWELSIGLCSG